MSDMDARGDDRLDRELSSYYRDLAGAPVPVKLHGRTVRSILSGGEARASGRGGRPGVWHGFSRVAPAALVVVGVAAIALAALPLMQHVPTPVGPTAAATARATASATTQATSWPMTSATPQAPALTTPSPFPSPLPSGATRVTVMNLGAANLTVTIGEMTVGQLDCGATGTYVVTSYPATFAADAMGSTASVAMTRASADQWWVYRPDGWTTGMQSPPTDRTYSVCTSVAYGYDPSGVATWSIGLPTIRGTKADATVNRESSVAADQWASELATALLALGEQRRTPTVSATVVGGFAQANTTMPGFLSLAFYLQPTLYPAPVEPIATWTGYLVLDLSDGHRVGVDELFTNPAQGLAVLSSQTRKVLGVSADGGAYAAETQPGAPNFNVWYPTTDGLQIIFHDPTQSQWDGALYQTVATIPWSVLKSLIKPDSPVRAVMP